ncbi:MAG: hypothetical protein II098_09605 [Treponema sp.]|nr:hypothetical protein [Treponema sp.]
MKEKERNVALIDKAYKLTRSEYLENKTELSDEDIVRILDLPAEKEIRTQIKSYTDKDYLELAKDNTKLSQLTESLKNDAEYLTYRGSYIAKSKLLYESPVTLCNEIPSLLIGEEIGESFYLLPYGYAKDKSENFKKFADMLERDNFIDIKRNYSTKLKHNFKKGHNQGNNIFFFITSDKTDYEKIRQEINKCVYNRKEVQNKTAKYIVYIEQSNRCGSFSFDTTGKLVTEKEYTLKQIRSFDNERPLVARGRMQSIPSGTSLILNNNDENVNDLFHSLLLRGELEMIRVHPELHIYSDKYKEACSTLGKITNETHSKLLKSSNLAFLQSEKQTQFYKDLQKGEEKTMENTNEEIINQETENSIKKEAKAIIFTPENADEFAKMANEGNIPLKADEAKKLIEIFQKAGLTLRYEPLPDALVINGKKEVLNVLNYEENMIINIPEVLKLAGIKVEENSQTSDKRVEFSAEEEKEYQEWEEMLDDDQKAEEIIEKNQRKEPEEQNEDKIQKMALSKGVLESLTEIGNTIKNDSAMILKSPSFGDVTFSTGVFGDLSKKNNGGYGINHIVEGRYVKDGLTQQDIASLLYLIKDAVETTTVEIDDSKSRQNIIKDGIWVTVRKDFDGIKQNWIVTGFAENDEKGQITKEATDAIKAVNAQYGYAPEHLFVSEQVGAVIASLNNVAQNILMSSDEERIKNFKEVYKNTQFLDSVIKNENTFTKEATDTIQTVIARNSYALEHSSIREQVGAVVESIALDNEKSTIKNNNEKSQELFMFQGLQLPEAFNNLDPNKILHQTNSAVNNKSRLQGEKTMAPEKQIIAEIGFADGEIKQYEDSKEFLDDLNAASKENAYDTSLRVYAESDKLKQKAADVKLDNYDPMEAAERIHNGYEWNDVEHEAVQFTQSAEGRRLLKDAENGRLTMLDARDILDAVEKNGMTLRYDPLPNSYVVDGWTAADGEKLDNYVVSMSELKRLAGIEISENSQQNQIQEKKTARTPEEEQAYQEWLEMLDDNQQAEDRMERMQGVPSEEQKPLPKWQQRLNTLLAATEDVSRDEQIIQAVNGSASLFIPDEREYKSYQNQLDEYLAGKLKPSDFISLGKTPAVLEKIGVNQNEVVIFQNVIDKALRQPQTDENGKFVQGHEIDVSVLEKLPEYISNPLMVFKSDTVPNSKVIMTEYQDVNDRTVVIALHCDSRADSGKLIVNRISSVYRKDNDYFFLNQIKKGNLEYIDEKRSQEWAVRQRLQLPPLTDILGYNQNITTKEDFVNSQKSLSKKRNVEHEEAPTQGDKSMPGEKKELSFSEQVDLVLAGKYNRFDALKVCDTPDLLLQSGLKQLPMLYTQRHLREAIQQKDLHNHTHGIKIEQIKSLPELIKNPVMIYDSLSRSDSLLVLTSEIDVDKMPIVVSIRPNGKGTYELKKVDSNFITSMYGRENFEQHINSVINNGKIIYWNKEKSQALFSVLGQRLPKGLNNLDPYKILHQTNSVVNTQFQTRTTEQETPTIKNNNEKSQERHSDAKDYLIQTTRLFLSKLKEKNLPFLRGKERGPNIIIRPQAARDAATGKAFTGYTQLMAQALIQALYDQKKLPELEYDLITYDQAKACGTFIKKGSPHITLTNYNRTTNSASKQMYYFKSGCNSPEMIDLHKESIARNRAIKRIRLSLENKEIPSERQTEEKNKITLLHYEEMTYLKALNKDTEQYFDSLTAEEKEMLKTLCSKEPLTQKTVRELAETLRKDSLISAQLSSQKNSGRSFDATECIVPEDFIGKAMAAASLGCSLETTQGTIDRITKDLHQTLSRNIEHYDYGKPFETGEIINGKCRNNIKDMCNKEYEAEELAKKIEQQQMALKKNPINALMELLNRNDLSDRTIGGYER